MAKREIRVDYLSGNVLFSIIDSDVLGSPQMRVDGGVWGNPFEQDAGLVTFLISSPSVGSLLIEYQDDNGIVKICDFIVLADDVGGANENGCVLGYYGVGVGRVYSDGFGHRRDYSQNSKSEIVDFGHRNSLLGKGKLRNGFESANGSVCASFDNFITQKCGVSADPSNSGFRPAPFDTNPSGNFPISYKFNSGSCGEVNIANDFLYQDIAEDLEATFTKVDTSANGASDGSIVVTVTSGSGDYSYSWADSAVTAPTRTGLPFGTYTVTITDNVTLQTLDLDVIINEPEPEPEPVPEEINPVFEVPIMQSFHFVNKKDSDSCNVFQGLDNKLLCEQEHPYFKRVNYYQKVNQCDVRPLQIKAAGTEITIELKDYINDSVIASFSSELKVNNTNRNDDYNIRIENNGGGSSRVYFTDFKTIPFLANIGDAFQIQSNSDGFEGNYSIIDVQEDIATGSQYLVINKNYGIASPTSLAIAVFKSSIVDFDIYEAVINFNAIPEGLYYLEVVGINVENSFEKVYTSEPIEVKLNHKDTNLIEWTNFDSAYDIDYTTGIEHSVRVESVFFKRTPSAEKEQLRNTNGSLATLTSKPRRMILLETYHLPPYLHEKLSIVFEHDRVKVQKIEFENEDGYQEPQYITRFLLSNSSISLEQKNYLNGTYNGDDIGGLNGEQGFILTQKGFIKR